MISTNMAAMLKDMEGVQYRSVLGHTCDQLGMCQHPRLDCSESTCHRALLDDGHVDVPLPALGGGNFWLDPDPREDPNGVTPGSQQPHLMDVTTRPNWRDTGWFKVYYWFWVVMTYLAFMVAAGYVWGKYGESAMRAFWRVVSGVS